MFHFTEFEKEALFSLLGRFDSVKSQLNGSNEVLTKITEDIQKLMNLHDQFKKLKKEVPREFMVVVPNADEILNELKSGRSLDAEKVGQLNHLLSTAVTDLCSIHDKLLSSITVSQDTNSASSSLQGVTSAVALTSRGDTESHPIHTSFLNLTINNLDAQLKRCLFCLSIFPENQIIKKKLLIHWWIGEGIITTASQGNSCFSKLLDLDFIIPIRRERCQEVHSCKLHPWIRNLLVTLAKNSGFLLVDSEGNPREDHSRTHRAFLRKGGSLTGSNQEVLTLYNFDEPYLEIQNSWFAKKTKISTIQLGRWQESDDHHIEVTDSNFLNSTGTCKKLKYLSLRGISRIENVPDSIQKLENLQILDLQACHNLEKLPEQITALKSLEYLDVSECYLLEEMPKGLDHLSKLEVLKGFVIASSRSKNPGRLGDLAKLTKLRKLSITIGQESAPSVNEFKRIGEINALRSLTITWGLLLPEKQSVQSTSTETREPDMNYTFPPYLEKLDLRCFPAESFKESISPTKLGSLKKLYLSGGKLKTLGKEVGWPVEILRVNFLKELDYDFETIESNFRAVKVVQRNQCPNLKNWPCGDMNGTWRKDDAQQANTAAVNPLGAMSSEITEST
jgi:Leucine-rich repeat (LRR) protein